MHPKVRHALEEIDAMVFSGDTLDDAEDRATFVKYVMRWLHVLVTERPEGE